MDRAGHEPEAEGHATIQMAFDTHGHLFTDNDADQRAAEDIQVRLLGK